METLKDYWYLLVEKAKGAKRSVTIWFNGVLATVAAILPMLNDALPTIQQYLPGSKVLFAVVIFGNIFLRFKTSQALENK